MSDAATQAKLRIYNDAMDIANTRQIESFGNDSPTAAQAARRFDRIARFALSIHPWTFAKFVVPLSKLTNPPDSQAANVFEIPPDMIVLALYDREDCEHPYLAFRKIGSAIHAEADALWAEVKSLNPDLSIAGWIPSFQEAVTKAIAADRVDSRTKRADLTTEAYGGPGVYPRGGLIATAAEEDGQTEPGGTLQLAPGPLVDARR